MDYFNTYVIFVFFFKILFAILAVLHLYFVIKGESNTGKDIKIEYWKDRVEFVFIALMSFMMMYLFYPRSTKPIVIDFEIKIPFLESSSESFTNS